MTLQYEDIFSVFLNKITDYSFLEYDDNYIRGEMVLWLRAASAFPRLRNKFKKLNFKDEISTLDFELKVSVDEYSDMEFIKDILARGMVISWLEPQVKNILLTKQMFGGKEERFFAQSNHLKEVQGVLDNAKIELTKILRDYGYINNLYIKE